MVEEIHKLELNIHKCPPISILTEKAQSWGQLEHS